MKVICENYNRCKYKDECLHSKPHNAMNQFSSTFGIMDEPSKFACHVDKNAPYDFAHTIWINNNLSNKICTIPGISGISWSNSEKFCNCNTNKMLKFLRKEKLEKIQKIC